LIYNSKFINVDKIARRLAEGGNIRAFQKRFRNGIYLLSSTFLFSSVMNYLLANAESAAGEEVVTTQSIQAIINIVIASVIVAFLWWALSRAGYGGAII
jgi:hypothetical protein